MTCLAEMHLWFLMGLAAFIGAAAVFGTLLWFGLSPRAKKRS